MGFQHMNQINQFNKFIENNDIKNVKIILNDFEIPTSVQNSALIQASIRGHFNVIELLMSNQLVNPAYRSNTALNFAFLGKYYSLVDLLWNDIRVKNTSINHYKDLKNYLIKKEIENKVEDF
jgi:hypothetical protein